MAFTCRLTDQYLAEIEKVKSEQKIRTTAKALEHIVGNYRHNELRLEMVEGELNDLKRVIADKARIDQEYQAAVAGMIPQ